MWPPSAARGPCCVMYFLVCFAPVTGLCGRLFPLRMGSCSSRAVGQTFTLASRRAQLPQNPPHARYDSQQFCASDATFLPCPSLPRSHHVHTGIGAQEVQMCPFQFASTFLSLDPVLKWPHCVLNPSCTCCLTWKLASNLLPPCSGNLPFSSMPFFVFLAKLTHTYLPLMVLGKRKKTCKSP